MKKILMILSSVLLLCCCTPNDAPSIPYIPKVYKAMSDEEGICRLEDHDENEDTDEIMQCIYADEDHFDNYMCVENEDFAMLQKYIVELISSCNEWDEEKSKHIANYIIRYVRKHANKGRKHRQFK